MTDLSTLTMLKALGDAYELASAKLAKAEAMIKSLQGENARLLDTVKTLQDEENKKPEGKKK